MQHVEQSHGKALFNALELQNSNGAVVELVVFNPVIDDGLDEFLD